MGGYGSGGGRVNSGRKSKKEAERALTGARIRTMARDAGAPKDIAAVHVPMPGGMTAGQQSAWVELAPFAIAAGTLVTGTASAFRDLCEVVALRRDMLVRIGEQTLTAEGDPHPLLVHERQYRLREEAGKARFALAPAGKSMAAVKADADPFGEFDKPTVN